ncbi:hypothetical protein BDV97DRAFT_394335 [Delphinella strobiligena]|nr:hypothetical protein BDV97DRAFT_394335 [Delphinella strobiligena]
MNIELLAIKEAVTLAGVLLETLRREAEFTRIFQARVRSAQETDATFPTLPPHLLRREDADFDYERVPRGGPAEEAEKDAVPIKTEAEEEDAVSGLKTEAQEDESVSGLRTEFEAMPGLETKTREPRAMAEFESEDEQDGPMPTVKMRPQPLLPTRSQQHFRILEAPGKAKNWAEQEQMMERWREVRARYKGSGRYKDKA